jgi:hypothetical protein
MTKKQKTDRLSEGVFKTTCKRSSSSIPFILPNDGRQPKAAYQHAYHALYGRTSGHVGRFRRDLLPDPFSYYEHHLARVVRRDQWAAACCPFHEDKNPSLSVNLLHGGFKCHGCGASGGDVLAFHMRLTGMDFIDAAKALGAWRDR